MVVILHNLGFALFVSKVYGNNVEIQALSEIYNRPIHIYSYSTGDLYAFYDF